MRSIFILATGTAGVQLIGILMMPFVTCLYGPEEFGVLGTFTAIAGILMPIAALTFPVATVLARTDNEASVVSTLSVLISIGVAIATLGITLITGEYFAASLGIKSSLILYFIPLTLIFSTCFQVNRQWAIRKGYYRSITRVALVHAIVFNALKVLGGVVYPSHLVLITLFCIGPLAQGIMLSHTHVMRNLKVYSSPSRRKLSFAINKYRSFPLFRAPQTALRAFSESVPVILFSAFFGPKEAGYYSLTRIVLGMPVGLLGQSITDVLYPKFTSLKDRRGEFKLLLTKSALFLSILGALIYTAIYIIGPLLFRLVFGAEWQEAGEFARWLSIGLFFIFLARPFISVVPVLNLHRAYLVFEAVLLVGMVLGAWAVYHWGGDSIDVVQLISIVTGVGHMILIFYVFFQVEAVNQGVG